METLRNEGLPDNEVLKEKESHLFSEFIQKHGFKVVGGVLALLSTGCSPKDFEGAIIQVRDMTVAAAKDASADARASFAAHDEPESSYQSNAGIGVAGSAGTDYGVAGGAGAYYNSYQSNRQKKFNH